jgi:putative ABC transport system ATP-binding protein
MSAPLVEIDKVSKIYHLDETVVIAVDSVSLKIFKGDFVVISGPSGSGKSTLLNLLGCIDKPTAGTLFFDGVDITNTSLEDLNDLRLHKLGFIYQSFNLIPVLTAYENVELPLIFKTPSSYSRRSEVEGLLKGVGLGDRMNHRPGKLSGGQRQRVAIARALAGNPKMIIADEPTANLDSKTSESIMTLLLALNTAKNLTIVIASHDPLVISKARTRYEIRDGRIISGA